MCYLISKKEVEQESQHNHLFKGVRFFLSTGIKHNATESKTKVATFRMLQTRMQLSCVCGSCNIAPKKPCKNALSWRQGTHHGNRRNGRRYSSCGRRRGPGFASLATSGLIVSQEVYKLPPDFRLKNKKLLERFMLFFCFHPQFSIDLRVTNYLRYTTLLKAHSFGFTS